MNNTAASATQLTKCILLRAYSLIHEQLLAPSCCAKTNKNVILACLHDQNKSGFFGGPAFFQPIRAIFLETFQIALIGWIKAGPPKKPLLF